MLAVGWLAALPPCIGFEGWLFDGMDSKPLLNKAYGNSSAQLPITRA
jgi:hypothetical protein